MFTAHSAVTMCRWFRQARRFRAVAQRSSGCSPRLRACASGGPTKKVWDAFIANYPSGFYTELPRRSVLLWRVAKQTEQANAATRQKPPRRPGSPPRRPSRLSRQRFSPRKPQQTRPWRKLRMPNSGNLLNRSASLAPPDTPARAALFVPK